MAEEDRLGLPRPFSGAFATVYKFKCAAKVWAVRCFVKEFQDQRQRYSAIGAQLSKVKLPFTVGFDFLTNGIRVRGNWYPVLKMEWVQGESLIRFVSNNIKSPQTLRLLGLEIVQMARALYDAGIAHGDLQHGNILVVNGKPKLIDYDGMFVPALRGLGSHEVGHANYQHPARKEDDFGPGLDNFSVWVIYLSLLALSERPELWRRFNGGDECILFRRKDFERPDRSFVLRELERSSDPVLQALAAMFRSLLSLHPLQIPLIDPSTNSETRQPAPRAGLDWVKDHVPSKTEPSGKVSSGTLVESVGQPPAIIDASWILDNWQEEDEGSATPSFENSTLVEHVVLAGTVGLAVILMLLAATRIISILAWIAIAAPLIVSNLGFWKYRFMRDGGLACIRDLRRQIHDLQDRIENVRRKLEEMQRSRKTELDRFGKIAKQMQSQLSDVPHEEQRLIAEVNARASNTMMQIDQLRAANHQNEDIEIRQNQKEMQRSISDIEQRIAGLAQAERDECEAILSNRQAQHMQLFLESCRLADKKFDGIADKLMDNLRFAGYLTAANIDSRVFKVRGIGDKKGKDLLNWRIEMERQAKMTGPNALPPEEVIAIRARYQQQQGSLQARRASEIERYKDAENGIQKKYQLELDNFGRKEIAIQADLQQQLIRIKKTQENRRTQIENEMRRLVQEQKTSSLLNDLSRLITERGQELAKLNWERARSNKRLMTMSAQFTFHNYVKRIFSSYVNAA